MELAQNETNPHEEGSFHDYTHMIATALNLTGIAANLMIISTILSSKSLQTRSYLLLLNFSIFDVLFKMLTSRFVYMLLATYLFKDEMICVIRDLEMIFLFGEVLFMLAFVSNWVLKIYRTNDVMFFFICYAIIASCLATAMTLCVFDIFNYIIYALIAFTCIVLLIVVIAKGVNRFRKSLGDPLSPDSVKRLNVASIYTYTMLILVLTGITTHRIKLPFLINFVVFMMILIPVFIHLYLTKADEVYKACFLDLIFCRRRVEPPIENVNSQPITDENP